jgi:hypothetical protein
MAKKSMKERMLKKREELKARSQSGNIIYLKPDKTIRVRLLPVGEDEEFIKEITQFYLGGEIKGVISPSSFGEPCAIMEAYEELKQSKDDDDKTLAKSFAPRQRYLAYCAIFKEGSSLETESEPKWVLLTSGMYQMILDLYLDEDWGDMTDPIEGYDLKLSRTGSGKNDTEYTVLPGKRTKTPKEFNKVYDIDKEIRKIMPTYEETKEIIAKFLNVDKEDEDDEPKKEKKVKKGLKKSRSTDAD